MSDHERVSVHLDFHLHIEKPIEINLTGGQGQVSLADIAALITNLGARMDANLQKLSDDLDQIKQQSGDYIAARDAIDATKDATIADLTAKLAAAAEQGTVDAATIADFRSGVDAALAKAEADKGLLTVPATA